MVYDPISLRSVRHGAWRTLHSPRQGIIIMGGRLVDPVCLYELLDHRNDNVMGVVAHFDMGKGIGFNFRYYYIRA